MTLTTLIQKGGLAKLATATVATMATEKPTQQATVAQVAGVAVANALEQLIPKPKHVLVSYLKPEEESAIRAWLMFIEETDLEIIAHVLNQCRTDSEAREYFICRASEVQHHIKFYVDQRQCPPHKNVTRSELSLGVKPGEILDKKREQTGAKVRGLMEGKRFAVLVEDGNTDPVIATIGIQNVATFEMAIPLHSYNGILLLELIEKHYGEHYANI